jgi:hypothetical protein
MDNLQGHDAYIARLRAGDTITRRGKGNSMTPIIKSGQKQTLAPVRSLDDIKKGDAVYCKVGRFIFTHKVTAIRGDQVQISNNHGHVNGWITIDNIYGKLIKVEN